MKKIAYSIVVLAWALSGWAQTIEPAPPTVESLDREVNELTLQLRTAHDQVADLRDRVELLEKRMGETFRLPTPFDTVERRLEDLEKDVDRLKRR